MARVNVYLPDDLAARVKEADLNVSAIAQSALEEALQRSALANWWEKVRAQPSCAGEIDTARLVREIRDEREVELVRRMHRK